VVGGVFATAPAQAAPPPVSHSVVVNPDPVDNTPHVQDGKTQAVAELGDRVLIGGLFNQVRNYNGGVTFTRHNLFAYSKATGTVDASFDPNPDGQITAMLPSGDGGVFIAGQFKTFNGADAPYLVKLDGSGYRDTSFAARPDGMVYDIQLVGDVLYVGGSFTRVNGTVRTNFAMVDAGTGALLGENVPFTDAVGGLNRVVRFDATPDGQKLVVTGHFLTVAGVQRENIAVLDVAGTTLTVNGWHTADYASDRCGDKAFFDTYLKDIDISPDGTYFVAVAIGGPHGTATLCDSAVRWELSETGEATPTWRDYPGGDSLTAVAVTGAAVYVGGHQRWMNNPFGSGHKRAGAVDRVGIAALDPASGLPLSWNPGRERGLRVWRMTATADGLYVLSDSSKFANEWHPRLTYLVTAGGASPVRAIAATLPTNLGYVLAGKRYERSFDGTTVGTQQQITDGMGWSGVRGVFAATDRMYRFKENGKIQVSMGGAPFVASPTWTKDFLNVTAVTYATGAAAGGQVLYANQGDAILHARGFGVENGLVAGLTEDVSGPLIDGMDWTDVRGLVVIDGVLYHSHADGTLRRTDMSGAHLLAATTQVVSGPAIDGINWSKTWALHAVADAA
jgi:hypothetical protein